VFENKVVRRIFGPKKQASNKRMKKTHNEELHNIGLYSSTNIIKVIKSRRIRWIMNTRLFNDAVSISAVIQRRMM
jgi:hypothetical protein